MCTLLTPREVDRMLRYPRGRSLRLARAGKLPHVQLPDGEIRFSEEQLERVIREQFTRPAPAEAVAHA